MKTFKIFQVDAFASKVFSGNPAAVIPLEGWIDERAMQSIAMENNLSETVFFTLKGNKGEIRWFSPSSEIDLCGHATLAAAFVAFEKLGIDGSTVQFTSKSGPLTVTRNNSRYTLDFPTRKGAAIPITSDMKKAFGVSPIAAYQSRDLVLEFGSEEEILRATPNFELLSTFEGLGVVITAPGNSTDFVSRAFFPKVGVPEDPVTGSSHCTLTHLWAEKLGKNNLTAKQLSARGGELYCRVEGSRTYIEGEARLFLEGDIFIS